MDCRGVDLGGKGGPHVTCLLVDIGVGKHCVSLLLFTHIKWGGIKSEQVHGVATCKLMYVCVTRPAETAYGLVVLYISLSS